MITAVIIDDIPEAITVLTADLETYCKNIEVIGSANGVVSGAKAIKELNPDLVFLDIQMPDGTGFDLLEIISDSARHSMKEKYEKVVSERDGFLPTIKSMEGEMFDNKNKLEINIQYFL